MHGFDSEERMANGWRAWAGRHRALCLVLALVAGVLAVLPVSFLSVSMSQSNFPGYSSPIFIVPVVMLAMFGIAFLFFLISLIFSRKG